MKPGNEIIAHNIRLMRKLEGGSQDDFAKKYGAKQKTIWAYENGDFKPKIGFLQNLSKGTGISPETLLSIKLKIDRSGNIINLPDKEQQIKALREDLRKTMDQFRAALEMFFTNIESINDRLNKMEMNNKKVKSR